MSSAAATADAPAAPKSGGKKKLILILVVALLLVGAAGGGALFFMKSKQAAAAEAEDGDDDAAPVKAQAKKDDKAVPTFVPLDPFTVNLADREAERYAQIGITLELDDAKVGDKIKLYMPAIRNNILLLLSQKTAADLQGREGKEKTARQIQREAARALGVDVPDDEEDDAKAKAGDDEKPKKKKKRKPAEPLPITRVHFSNFIIQ